MKNILLIALLLFMTPHGAAAQNPPPEPKREKLFNAETFTLDNGLQVVVVPNHRAPVVLAMVWYKVGNADEVSGKSGLAHFLEHLMFKGSPNVPPGELSRRVRAMGGSDNAFTTADTTAYHQTVAIEHLEDVMTMEADRMKAITVPADQFESERQVVLEERRQRTENNPQSYFIDQMRHALFPAHPYGVPVIGWKQDIEKLTREDALAWHDRWYVPNNAILVVAGDITAAQLKPLAEKIYGPIPARPITAAPLPPVNQFPGDVRMTLRDPRVRQSQFIRLYRVPAMTGNKPDSLALDLFEEIVSGNPSTRLYQALVVKQKLATSANIGYSDSARGPSTLSITISPAPGVPFDKIEAALDKELKSIAKKGVTGEELAAAKTRIRDSLAFTRDNLSDPAHIIGGSLASGQSLDDIEYYADDIDTVTAARIQDVVKKYLIPGDTPTFVTGTVIAATLKPGQPAPAPMPQQEIR